MTSMDKLVQRFSEGDHPIVARRVVSVRKLKQSIDRGYVLIAFTGTRGGTELGVRLDETLPNLSSADFEQGAGTVHLVGNLILNYVKVRCVADVDLATLKGTGHRDIREEEEEEEEMRRETQKDNLTYKVVINHEKQYSIWPAYREPSLGWREAGKEDPKNECLAHISEVWTDYAPTQPRTRMEEMEPKRKLPGFTNSLGDGRSSE
jgi:uncharacterized protein YbdZ (MbtH family)